MPDDQIYFDDDDAVGLRSIRDNQNQIIDYSKTTDYTTLCQIMLVNDFVDDQTCVLQSTCPIPPVVWADVI